MGGRSQLATRAYSLKELLGCVPIEEDDQAAEADGETSGEEEQPRLRGSRAVRNEACKWVGYRKHDGRPIIDKVRELAARADNPPDDDLEALAEQFEEERDGWRGSIREVGLRVPTGPRAPVLQLCRVAGWPRR